MNYRTRVRTKIQIQQFMLTLLKTYVKLSTSRKNYENSQENFTLKETVTRNMSRLKFQTVSSISLEEIRPRRHRPMRRLIKEMCIKLIREVSGKRFSRFLRRTQQSAGNAFVFHNDRCDGLVARIIILVAYESTRIKRNYQSRQAKKT